MTNENIIRIILLLVFLMSIILGKLGNKVEKDFKYLRSVLDEYAYPMLASYKILKRYKVIKMYVNSAIIIMLLILVGLLWLLTLNIN